MTKILIAYDGSECSEKALGDLRRAGMPEEAEAVVLSVADNWIDDSLADNPAFATQYSVFFGDNYSSLQSALKEAKAIAAKAAETLKRYFPGWSVEAESVADCAPYGVIGKIESWKPDLVVMGSHGRSAVGRVLFGSVSHRILSHVHCNLRIARESKRDKKSPPRILVAVDGSQESETAFEAALHRNWPKGTRIRIATVVDPRVVTAYARPTGPIRFWSKDEDTHPMAWIDRMFADQSRRIEEKEFIADAKALTGDPKRALLEEAEKWKADCIFVGPRGLTGRQRVIAGSVSTAVAMYAHCSVEVVHRLWTETSCCESVHEQHRACMSRK